MVFLQRAHTTEQTHFMWLFPPGTHLSAGLTEEMRIKCLGPGHKILVQQRIGLYVQKPTSYQRYYYTPERQTPLFARKRETSVKDQVVPATIEGTASTSTYQPSDVHQHSALIGIVHLPFSSQPSHFLHQPASSLASLSSFDPKPPYPMPLSRRDHPLSSTHVHTNEPCLP